MPVFDGKDLQVVDLDPSASPLHATAVRLFDEPVRGVLAAPGQWVVVAAQSSTRRGSAQAGAMVVLQVDPAAGPRVIGRVDLAQVGSLNPGMRFSSARIAGDRVYLTTAQPDRPGHCRSGGARGARGPVLAAPGRGLGGGGRTRRRGLRGRRGRRPARGPRHGARGGGGDRHRGRRQGRRSDRGGGSEVPVLYVADAGGKLWLFDMSNPTRPTLYTYALVDGRPRASRSTWTTRAPMYGSPRPAAASSRFGWMLSAIL